MGNKESKTEEIVVQAAGVGSNKSLQSTEQPFSRNEWMTGGLLVMVILAFFLYGFQRVWKATRLMVQREIQKNDLRKSREALNV